MLWLNFVVDFWNRYIGIFDDDGIAVQKKRKNWHQCWRVKLKSFTICLNQKKEWMRKIRGGGVAEGKARSDGLTFNKRHLLQMYDTVAYYLAQKKFFFDCFCFLFLKLIRYLSILLTVPIAHYFLSCCCSFVPLILSGNIWVKNAIIFKLPSFFFSPEKKDRKKCFWLGRSSTKIVIFLPLKKIGIFILRIGADRFEFWYLLVRIWSVSYAFFFLPTDWTFIGKLIGRKFFSLM